MPTTMTTKFFGRIFLIPRRSHVSFVHNFSSHFMRSFGFIVLLVRLYVRLWFLRFPGKKTIWKFEWLHTACTHVRVELHTHIVDWCCCCCFHAVHELFWLSHTQFAHRTNRRALSSAVLYESRSNFVLFSPCTRMVAVAAAEFYYILLTSHINLPLFSLQVLRKIRLSMRLYAILNMRRSNERQAPEVKTAWKITKFFFFVD